MKHLRATLIFFITLTFVAAFAVSAETQTLSTALGSDGQLVSLLSGAYGELFPRGNEARADVHVLALRRSTADGQQYLELVPATTDSDLETAAELILEPVSGISYVFWQSWPSLIQSRFQISAFDGESWDEPIHIAGSGFAWRTSPAFAVTRDRFSHIGAGSGAQVERTILHVVWSEERETGFWATKYAPLILENGRYIGQHPVLVLNDLVSSDEAGPFTDLQVAPVIRSRDSQNSIVTAFLDQSAGKIVTVESKFAAGELSVLGDEVDSVLADPSLDDVESLVTGILDRVESFSDELRPEILKPIINGLDDYIRDQAGPEGAGIGSARDGARHQLVDVGFRVTDGEIRRVTDQARHQLVDVGVRGHGQHGPRPAICHDSRSTVATTFTLPELESTPEILLSNSGRHLLLAWAENDRIRFQETASDGSWGEIQQVLLTDQLDAAEALDILQRRVDQK